MKAKSFWQWLKWKIIGPSKSEIEDYFLEQHRKRMGRTKKRKKS